MGMTFTGGPLPVELDLAQARDLFRATFGVEPSPNEDAARLLRRVEDFRVRQEFEQVFGVPPDPNESADRIQRRIDAAQLDSDAPLSAAPIQTPTGTTLPQGGRVVVVRNPEGSDAQKLWYVVYEWRGVQFAYEVGDDQQFVDLIGPARNVVDDFDEIQVVSQAQFDDEQFVLAGSIEQKLGQSESEASRIEREVRAAGLEDIPDWIAGSQQALALVGKATGEGWSSGRLWQELSDTQAFQGRFGAVIDRYLQENMTIGDAVDQIVRDENEIRTALRPFLAGADEATTTEFVQSLIGNGWTPGSVAQVAEQMQVLTRDPDRLTRTNLILEASGLEQLDEVGFINALNGVGPQDTIEALNTASAAEALDQAGIDLDDEGLRAMLDLVDTSDRLLTVDSFGELAQQLSFNLIRNRHEVDIGKLGLTEDDLVAAAFGRESPNGKSSGETLGLLARLERDRRAAAQGFDQTSGFVDDEGRLRLQGLGNL